MLFTFPSQYSFTIGLTGVFSLTGWSRLIHAEFLVLRATQDTAMPCFASYTGLSPPMVVLSRTFYSQNTYNIAVLLPRRCRNNDGLGSSPVARHYWGNHYLFSLPRGTKMFQFPRFASLHFAEIYILQMYGLSHSEILGSKVICTYPKLIAAYHVLHRLCEPRHPPYALSYFFLYRFISFSVSQIKRTVAHTFSCIVS